MTYRVYEVWGLITETSYDFSQDYLRFDHKSIISSRSIGRKCIFTHLRVSKRILWQHLSASSNISYDAKCIIPPRFRCPCNDGHRVEDEDANYHVN